MVQDRTYYIEEYKIRGSETDRTGKLSLQGLTNVMQETAGNHAMLLGFSVQELQKQGISWLLYRMQLRVDKWPEYGDLIRIETWPSGIEGIYAFREFEIFLGEKKLGSASTAWLVFNLATRKLIKIPPEFGERIPGTPEGPRIQLKRKIQFPKQVTSKEHITVGWQHLDLNNHTNNVHYYAWMMGSTPETFHIENTLTEMDAIFKGETGLGDQIVIESSFTEEKLVHKLSLSQSGKEVMVAETTWSKNLVK